MTAEASGNRVDVHGTATAGNGPIHLAVDARLDRPEILAAALPAEWRPSGSLVVSGTLDGSTADPRLVGASLGRRRHRRSRARTGRVDGQERRSGSAVRCRAAGVERRRQRPHWFRDGVAFRGPREPSQEPADVARGAAGEDDRRCPTRRQPSPRLRTSKGSSIGRSNRQESSPFPRSRDNSGAGRCASFSQDELRFDGRRPTVEEPFRITLGGFSIGLARVREQRERRDGHARRPHRGRDRLPSTRHRHTVAGGGTGSCAGLAEPGR